MFELQTVSSTFYYRPLAVSKDVVDLEPRCLASYQRRRIGAQRVVTGTFFAVPYSRFYDYYITGADCFRSTHLFLSSQSPLTRTISHKMGVHA